MAKRDKSARKPSRPVTIAHFDNGADPAAALALARYIKDHPDSPQAAQARIDAAVWQSIG